MPFYGPSRFIIPDFDANASGTKPTDIIQVGWILFATGATASKSATITFRTAFSALPIVLLTFGGDNTSGTTTYGSGSVANKAVKAPWATSITATNFLARVDTIDGTAWGAGDTVFAQYIAVGPP